MKKKAGMVYPPLGGERFYITGYKNPVIVELRKPTQESNKIKHKGVILVRNNRVISVGKHHGIPLAQNPNYSDKFQIVIYITDEHDQLVGLKPNKEVQGNFKAAFKKAWDKSHTKKYLERLCNIGGKVAIQVDPKDPVVSKMNRLFKTAFGTSRNNTRKVERTNGPVTTSPKCNTTIKSGLKESSTSAIAGPKQSPKVKQNLNIVPVNNGKRGPALDWNMKRTML